MLGHSPKVVGAGRHSLPLSCPCRTFLGAGWGAELLHSTSCGTVSNPPGKSRLCLHGKEMENAPRSFEKTLGPVFSELSGEMQQLGHQV